MLNLLVKDMLDEKKEKKNTIDEKLISGDKDLVQIISGNYRQVFEMTKYNFTHDDKKSRGLLDRGIKDWRKFEDKKADRLKQIKRDLAKGGGDGKYILKNEAQYKQIIKIWHNFSQNNKVESYSQGDINGRFLSQIIYDNHYMQEYGIGIDAPLDKFEVILQRSQGKKNFSFGYLDDTESICGFSLIYDSSSPKHWIITIIRNANAPLLKDRDVTIFSCGLNLRIDRGKKSDRSNTAKYEESYYYTLRKKMFLALGSKTIASLLMNIILSDNSINHELAQTFKLDPIKANIYSDIQKKLGTQFTRSLLETILTQIENTFTNIDYNQLDSINNILGSLENIIAKIQSLKIDHRKSGNILDLLSNLQKNFKKLKLSHQKIEFYDTSKKNLLITFISFAAISIGLFASILFAPLSAAVIGSMWMGLQLSGVFAGISSLLSFGAHIISRFEKKNIDNINIESVQEKKNELLASIQSLKNELKDVKGSQKEDILESLEKKHLSSPQEPEKDRSTPESENDLDSQAKDIGRTKQIENGLKSQDSIPK